MEFLKKFSDDLSNTTVGPPTFVQNDDQEAKGLNFRMMAANDLTASVSESPAPAPTQSSSEEPDPEVFIESGPNNETLLEKTKRPMESLIKAGTLIFRIKPLCALQEKCEFAPEGSKWEARGWKEGDDLCIRWCSYPQPKDHGSLFQENVLRLRKKFDEQKINVCSHDGSTNLKCGLLKIKATKFVEDPESESLTFQASELFEKIFETEER
eukprot:GHVP01002718.1.p1 GENE.GHVP01002718.1~~GHVP01002718.1.p1  ORF type:complete len:211 (+),score=38.24 GHVP01002718.1:382-1014(+)